MSYSQTKVSLFETYWLHKYTVWCTHDDLNWKMHANSIASMSTICVASNINIRKYRRHVYMFHIKNYSTSSSYTCVPNTHTRIFFNTYLNLATTNHAEMSKSIHEPWLHPCIHQRFHSILSTHLHGDLIRIIGGQFETTPHKIHGIFTWHWLDSYGKVWVNVPYMNPMGVYYIHFTIIYYSQPSSFKDVQVSRTFIYTYRIHVNGIFTYTFYHGNQTNVGTYTIYMDGMGEKSNKQIIRHAEFFRDML